MSQGIKQSLLYPYTTQTRANRIGYLSGFQFNPKSKQKDKLKEKGSKNTRDGNNGKFGDSRNKSI